MASLGGIRRTDRPLNSDERVAILIRMRKTELKFTKKASKALESFAIPLPDLRRVQKWKADRKTKIELENVLVRAAGVRRTVNPLEYKHALV